MNKKILAGTMAMALMAGQFSTMAFADSKDSKTPAKPAAVKTQTVKVFKAVNGKAQMQAVPLTEKEMAEFMKTLNITPLKNTNAVTVTAVKSDANGNVMVVETMPATQTIPAVKLVPANTNK